MGRHIDWISLAQDRER